MALVAVLCCYGVIKPFTRSRAYRKNDNAHCEQKNWTHARQLFGHERFEHPELVSLMNELYANEWSQFTNHFKPTFKLLKRDKHDSKTIRVYEPNPQTPYQRLLESGRIHYHLLVVLAQDIRTGLDFVAVERGIIAAPMASCALNGLSGGRQPRCMASDAPN